MKVTMRVNGAERTGDVEPRVLLVDFLRTNLALTGTHVGCDTTSCGACTVLLDGEPVKSCTLLAVQVDGREWPRAQRYRPCRSASTRSTACSAGSARPG